MQPALDKVHLRLLLISQIKQHSAKRQKYYREIPDRIIYGISLVLRVLRFGKVSELQGNRIWSFCPLLFANLLEFSSSVSREFVESSSLGRVMCRSYKTANHGDTESLSFYFFLGVSVSA
jgi:hypothetical protein